MKILRCLPLFALLALLISVPALAEGSAVYLDASTPEAFMNDLSLTEVVISEDSAGIGARAFMGCANLTSITLPYGVWDIGEDAFAGCDQLTIYGVETAYENRHAEYARAYGIPFVRRQEVSPDGFEYIVDGGESILIGYHGDVEDLSVPPELGGYPVSTIAQGAFDEYELFGSDSPDIKRLRSITIPGNVKRIEEYAFQCCEMLESVQMEEGLESIDKHSFYACTSLSAIRIPASVRSINGNPFASCFQLSEITVADGSKDFKSVDGLLYNAEGTHLISCPTNQSGEISILSGVRCIDEEAFANCTQLTAIHIPSTVTSIEAQSFWGCIGLTEINLPVSVERIKANPFVTCHELRQFTVSEDNPWYCAEGGVLYSKDMTRLICVPENTEGAFHVPQTVTELEANAFQEAHVSEVYLPEGLESIPDSAFDECHALTKVSLPASIQSIGPYAFAWCESLSEVEIPYGVYEIGDGAFMYCAGLQELTIPSTVQLLGEEVFSGCDALALTVDSQAALDVLTAESEAENTDESATEYALLQKGDRSEAVVALQQRLIDLGFLSGRADGDYGRMTADAVSAFQESVGLEVTGIADSRTQAALFEGDSQ